MGFWCPKLPENYTEKFYWDNTCTADYTQPDFVSSENRSENALVFEREWTEINGQLSPLIDEQESSKIALMKANNPGQFIIYSGRYTNAREKMLTARTLEHIKNEPLYYLKTRLYTFCRLWFTGINKTDWDNAKGLSSKLKILYPFLSSFAFIFLGLLFITQRILFKKISWSKFHLLYLLIFYYGLIHTPFAYQSRFTVPVHILILLLLSISVVNLIKNDPASDLLPESAGNEKLIVEI